MFELDARGILDDLPQSVVVIKPNLRLGYYNKAAAGELDLSGPAEKIVCHKAIWGSDNPCLQCPLRANGVNPLVREGELKSADKTCRIYALRRPDDTVMEVIADISQMEELKKRLERSVIADPSSDLLKRKFLREHLQREINRVRDTGGDLSLLMLKTPSLMDSSVVELPRAVARVFKSMAEHVSGDRNPFNRVYRFSDDSFAAILPDMDLTESLRNANRLFLELTERGIKTPKIGVTTCRRTTLADDMIHNAQRALFKAERSRDDPVAAV